MEATEIGQPLFELELGTEKRRLTPQSAGELLEWIEAEINRWIPVQGAKVTVSDPEFLSGVQEAFNELSRARKNASRAKQAVEQTPPGQSAPQISEVKASLERAFNKHKLPFSDSVTGQLILKLAQDGLPPIFRTLLIVLRTISEVSDGTQEIYSGVQA